MSAANKDGELRKRLSAIYQEWMRDENAQVGSERSLIGNNFDMLSEKIEALITSQVSEQVAEAREEQIIQDYFSLCLVVTDPEAHLIEWRDEQLATLHNQSKSTEESEE